MEKNSTERETFNQTKKVENMEILIDDEYENLCPKLTEEEYKILEENITTKGCLEAIKTHQGYIVDGHNRYEICKKHSIRYKTEELNFASREEAKNWIINNQMGRRNLTPEQKHYLIGKRYEAEKKAPIRPPRGKKGDQSDPLKTAKKIAIETNTSPGTVKRSAKFAQAVDSIARNTGEEFKQNILTRKQKMTEKDVMQVAKKSPEEQKKISEDLKNGKIGSIKEALHSNEAEAKQSNEAEAKQSNEAIQKNSNIQAQSSSMPEVEEYKCVKFESASLSKKEILEIIESATEQNDGIIYNTGGKTWLSAKDRAVNLGVVLININEHCDGKKAEVYAFLEDIKAVIGIQKDEKSFQSISQPEIVPNIEDAESPTIEDCETATAENEEDREANSSLEDDEGRNCFYDAYLDVCYYDDKGELVRITPENQQAW